MKVYSSIILMIILQTKSQELSTNLKFHERCKMLKIKNKQNSRTEILKISYSKIKLKVSEILFDPNNPRLNMDEVEVNKIVDEDVQNTCFNRLLKYVGVLIDSILIMGFSIVDSIVVVKLSENSNQYVVIEGNRRLLALKYILSGKLVGVSATVKKALESIEVLVLDDCVYDVTSHEILLTQAMRHVSGPKLWAPLAQGRVIDHLLANSTMSVADASKAIGIGRNIASRRMKAYQLFNNMLEDLNLEMNDSYEKYFSYFEEIVSNKVVRDYLGWNSTEICLEDDEKRNKLYDWIGLNNSNDEKRQIPGALNIRQLGDVIETPSALDIINTGGDIKKAYFEVQKVASEKKTTGYTKELSRILNFLSELTSENVEDMTDKDTTILNDILVIVTNIVA